MSGAPTSAPEVRAPAAARAAGWSAADLDWERTSEEALHLMASGCPEQACHQWREALDIARAAFAATDLRLGTSLANVAACVRCGDTGGNGARDGVALLAEARRIWDGAESQVETIELERRARSSLFHLRLELRHRGAYDDNARRRLRGCAEDACARLRALEGNRAAAPHDLARWRAERPARYGEVRKFLAACLLLAGPPAPEGS